MTREEREMLETILEAHSARLEDFAEAARSALERSRESQVAVARVEERLGSLEAGLVDVRDSLRQLTRALDEADLAAALREEASRREALAASFRDCRSASRRRLAWLIGASITAALAAGGYFLRELLEKVWS